ncbi:MAG: hypothetical protein U0798_15015 [Gemmataceae bacterium]
MALLPSPAQAGPLGLFDRQACSQRDGSRFIPLRRFVQLVRQVKPVRSVVANTFRFVGRELDFPPIVRRRSCQAETATATPPARSVPPQNYGDPFYCPGGVCLN